MKALPFLLCSALAALVTAGTTFAADKAAALAIVANKAAKLDDAKLAEIQQYFRAEKSRLPDGSKVLIAMQSPGRPERAAALKQIYKMSEAEFGDFFVEATFTGAVSAAPKALPSGAEVLKYVAANRGAVGYVRASEADDSVTIVKIDGHAPGDPGYALAVQ